MKFGDAQNHIFLVVFFFLHIHQTEQRFSGKFFCPTLQLKAWPNSSKLEVDPMILLKNINLLYFNKIQKFLY